MGGKPFEVALRFKRLPKSYSVHLIDFRHDLYVGTETPKNFSSEVRLRDPERHVDRTFKIWMNNPLRYGGDTLYQASFDRDNPHLTVLQVVTNSGWMIPYVACMLVGIGMLAQFSITLLRFLRRRGRADVGPAPFRCCGVPESSSRHVAPVCSGTTRAISSVISPTSG